MICKQQYLPTMKLKILSSDIKETCFNITPYCQQYKIPTGGGRGNQHMQIRGGKSNIFGLESCQK